MDEKDNIPHIKPKMTITKRMICRGSGRTDSDAEERRYLDGKDGGRPRHCQYSHWYCHCHLLILGGRPGGQWKVARLSSSGAHNLFCQYFDNVVKVYNLLTFSLSVTTVHQKDRDSRAGIGRTVWTIWFKCFLPGCSQVCRRRWPAGWGRGGGGRRRRSRATMRTSWTPATARFSSVGLPA